MVDASIIMDAIYIVEMMAVLVKMIILIVLIVGCLMQIKPFKKVLRSLHVLAQRIQFITMDFVYFIR